MDQHLVFLERGLPHVTNVVSSKHSSQRSTFGVTDDSI